MQIAPVLMLILFASPSVVAEAKLSHGACTIDEALVDDRGVYLCSNSEGECIGIFQDSDGNGRYDPDKDPKTGRCLVIDD